MSALCTSCAAKVPVGVEICEVCRTAQIPKVDFDSFSGHSPSHSPSHSIDHVWPWPGSGIDATSPFLEDAELVPFCGRGSELGRLGANVEKSLKQSKLRGCLVLGAPGMGKSRLLLELGRLCTEHLGLPRDRILVGTMPGEGASPVSALTEQLRTRCDIRTGEPAQSAREKILRTCRSLLSAVRATEVAHCLGELLGVPFPDSPVQSPNLHSVQSGDAMHPVGGEPRTYVALKRFLSADAARAPLVLLFDEMEHATDETLSLIHYLVESMVELPVFVGLFARPEFLDNNGDYGCSTGGLERIDLPPMPVPDAVEMFATAVGCEPEEIPLGLLSLVEQHSEGSPRKLVELLQLLTETGALTRLNIPDGIGDGAHVAMVADWDDERLAGLELPETLDMDGLVHARLAAMAPELRALLEKAAVCGEHFYLDALVMLERCEQAGITGGDDIEPGSLGDSPADPDGPALDELLASGERAAVQEALALLMRHGLVRAVRDSRLRGELEYRFAYPPWRDIVYGTVPLLKRRSYHRLLAHWLLLHQEQSSEEVIETVARHYERAGRGAAAAFFYRRVASMAAERGSYSKPPRLLLRALACLGSADVGIRVGLWHDLGAALVQKGDYDAAFGAYEKLLRLAHALAVRHHLAKAHHALGQIFRHKGEPSLALEHLTRAYDEYDELADAAGLSNVLEDLGQVLWLLGRTQEALDRASRALELRRRAGDRRKVAASLLQIGSIEQHRGLLDPAVSCYEEAMRKHEGDPQLMAACLEALGSVELLRGLLPAARTRFEQGIALIEPFARSPLRAVLLCRLGEVLLQQGHTDEAEAQLQTARELAIRLSARRALAEIQRLLGLVLLRRGQHKAALDCCQKALDQAQKNGVRHEIARALLVLGEVHAATLFDETVEGAHPAWDCFRRSVALLREVGDQAELALALYQLARHLIERGRVAPARATLREAEGIAARLHMRAAEEIRQMLAEI